MHKPESERTHNEFEKSKHKFQPMTPNIQIFIQKNKQTNRHELSLNNVSMYEFIFSFGLLHHVCQGRHSITALYPTVMKESKLFSCKDASANHSCV